MFSNGFNRKDVIFVIVAQVQFILSILENFGLTENIIYNIPTSKS